MIFDFNSSERKGLLVLALIIILSLAFRYALPLLKPSSKTDFTEFKNQIAEFSKSQKEYDILLEKEKLEKQRKYDSYKNNTYSNNYKYKKQKEKKVHYFKLDPNKATISDWEKFGFSQKQSKVIYNYIDRRGGVSSKEQLKDIFVIDSKKYNEMKSFIIIDESWLSNLKPKNKSYSKDLIIVELNSATKESLMSISGVGDVLSDRIIKYRDLLGGFYSVEQLNKVYGIKPEVFAKIEDNIIVEEHLVKKINVNFVDVKDLSSHPLISYKEAKALINFRTNKGFIIDLNVLFDNNILKNKELIYYLKTNE